MLKKGILIFLIYCFSFLSNPLFADGYSEPSKSQFVATISGGPAWYRAGETQTFYLQPGFKNTYAANSPTNTLASGELFLGLQQTIHSHYFAQLGVAAAASTIANLQGNIWELADPAFDNFTYQYKIQHSHLAIKGKLLTDVFNPSYLPYISGSVGLAFNRAYQFSMTPLLFQVLPEPPFQANMQTPFTYTVGVGLVKAFNQHWQIGIGYEFADWGRSVLGPSDIQTVNRGITLNHLYTNQLQFSLSFLS